MPKFIHAADIHLDSPLRGLERYEGAPSDEIRNASRRALGNLVRLAVEEKVDFVLLAGDLYDGDWRDYNTGLFFNQQMFRLRAADIPVVLVAGNHDAASRITRTLRLPDNVRALSTRSPETVLLPGLPVAIHGQGYPQRVVDEDLSRRYPDPISDLINIGLLHTSLTGRPGHAPYAPCSTSHLSERGYHYWALGHVHTREVVQRDPWIVFPGNIQGRHARETGAKGCTLVTTTEDRITSVEHRDLDVFRWAVCDVDATDAHTGEDVTDLVRQALVDALHQAGDRPLAARVRLHGVCGAHRDFVLAPERWRSEIRSMAAELGELWIEKLMIDTRLPVDIDKLRAQGGTVGALLEALDTLGTETDELDELLVDWGKLMRKLPEALVTGPESIDPARPEYRRALLQDVRQLLMTRVLGLGASER